MPQLAPLYTAANCQVAYQLNWSLSVFGRAALPAEQQWIEELKAAVEPDGVRVLERRLVRPNVLQFFLSTRPDVSPADVLRSIKGRLQYLVRAQLPRMFRRNYRIESVGSANLETIGTYVARQVDHHPMADSRMRERLDRLQYFDPVVRLDEIQYSSAGQFIYNLHLVFENAESCHEVREGILAPMRDMVIRASRAKRFRLSRIGLVSNHLHVTVGCGMTDAPLAVALGFMNNLAFVNDMKAMLKYSFYVGTIGNYDRQAIRRRLPGHSERVI